MYWVLANALVDEDNDADLSGSVNLELGGETSFKRGQIVDVPVSKIELVLDGESQMGRMTDNLSITEVYGLVFSSQLQELLHDLNVDNIQYINLDIVNPKTGDVFTDYKVANVIGLVDCVDKDKSDLKYHASGNIKRIKRLVLDELKIPPEIEIFRLTNRTILTIVHERIKNAIVNSGITGCVFYKVEEYH